MVRLKPILNELLTSYWAKMVDHIHWTGYSLRFAVDHDITTNRCLCHHAYSTTQSQCQALLFQIATVIKVKVIGREDEFLFFEQSHCLTYPIIAIILQKADFTIDLIELHDKRVSLTLRPELLGRG
jgi:NAD+ kinase